MNTMDEELKKACALYSEICNRSINGRGMSVSEVKKKYGFKKRDVVVLFQFLIDIADLDHCVDFVRYGSNNEIKGVEMDNLEESASDGSIYILIYDKGAFLLQDRIDETEISLNNDTFLRSIKINGANTALKEISNVSDTDELNPFVINKGLRKNTRIERCKKSKLIRAILEQNMVNIVIENEKHGIITKTISPLGLRYVKLLEKYELIYEENDKKIKSVDMSAITDIKLLEKKYSRSFNIYEYIKNERKTKMVFNVYDDGNVISKLDKILAEYDVSKQEKKDYIEYSFMVENADMFENLVKSYGRSVIVIEPASLRDKIYQETKKTFEFYETLSDEKPFED